MNTPPSTSCQPVSGAAKRNISITYPRDRIRTILFLGWFVQIALIPAILLVGFWFMMQLFSEVGALAQVQSGGVAYMAHVGGFTFGALTARVFESRKRRWQQGLE